MDILARLTPESTRTLMALRGELGRRGLGDAVVSATDFGDDPEQPREVAVWLDSDPNGDDPDDLELIGAGDTLAEALGDALETVMGWE